MKKKDRKIKLVSIIISCVLITNYLILVFSDFNENQLSSNIISLPVSSENNGTIALGIMFCIDISLSMDAEMVEDAKHSAHLIMDLVSNDTYVGLITFARYSYINVSLNRVNETNQRSNIENTIDSMTTKPYTNIYSALTDCIDEFNRFSFSSKHIILMSDGLPNQAEPGYEQFTSRSSDVWITDPDSPVLIANDSNILIHTVGYGSNNQALLEAFSSTTVSNNTSGEFFTSSESNALVMYFAALEGWKKQETYTGTVQEDETVLVRHYLIDSRYPYIRIWLFWDESEECILELIVKDENTDNMTSMSSGGQNPPLYAIYNCIGIDYIDIYILGVEINTTIDLSWTCSIESWPSFESAINEGGDMLFFPILILISIVSLPIGTIGVSRKILISKKKKREILKDINKLKPKEKKRYK